MEQAAAAAEAMQDQVAKLSQMVSVFELLAAGAPPVRAAPCRKSAPATVRVAAAAPRPALKKPAKAKTASDEWETF